MPLCLSVVVPPKPPPLITPSFILDSGATGTFVARSDVVHLQRPVPILNGPTVLAASGDVMRTTLHGTLPLSPLLSATAQSAFVIDDLRTGTLVSLAQLCDDDCLAIFSKFDVKIVKKDTVLITGTRLNNGLWSIPLSPATPSTPTHQANGILRLDKPKQELAVYHHVALGSPVPSTLLRAIRRGHLITFPGLTTELITKHLPKSVATTLGHQDQEARNIRSTTSTLIVPSLSESELQLDIAPTLAPRTHQLCVMLLDKHDVLKSYSDQTGLFPVPSSRGNHYLFHPLPSGHQHNSRRRYPQSQRPQHPRCLGTNSQTSCSSRSCP